MQGALFEQQHLPEDPFEFIKAHVDGQRNVLEGEGLQASYQQPPEPSPSITTLAPAIQVTPKEQERPGWGWLRIELCFSRVCYINTVIGMSIRFANPQPSTDGFGTCNVFILYESPEGVS
eukprot:scaffold14137_cov17-Tisochrysis_lutea.AAC.7